MADEVEHDNGNQDFVKTLASSMKWYVEFPHVDGAFMQVFDTLPGYQHSEN